MNPYPKRKKGVEHKKVLLFLLTDFLMRSTLYDAYRKNMAGKYGPKKLKYEKITHAMKKLLSHIAADAL